MATDRRQGFEIPTIFRSPEYPAACGLLRGTRTPAAALRCALLLYQRGPRVVEDVFNAMRTTAA